MLPRACSRHDAAKVRWGVAACEHIWYKPCDRMCAATVQVKNSLRAVNDRYEDAEDEPPPVRVVVAEGAEDVCIKASFPSFGPSSLQTQLLHGQECWFL